MLVKEPGASWGGGYFSCIPVSGTASWSQRALARHEVQDERGQILPRAQFQGLARPLPTPSEDGKELFSLMLSASRELPLGSGVPLLSADSRLTAGKLREDGLVADPLALASCLRPGRTVLGANEI